MCIGVHPWLPSVLSTRHGFLAVSSTGGYIPDRLELTIAHSVEVVVEVDTRADVPGREPDLIAECNLAVRLILQPQAAMLRAQRHRRGTDNILGDWKTGINPDGLLASINDGSSRFGAAGHGGHHSGGGVELRTGLGMAIIHQRIRSGE